MLWHSNDINSSETKRIDKMRLDDLKFLETLLIDRLSKEETLVILKTKVPQLQYFDKPEANSIGLGAMDIEFDKNFRLKKITSYSQVGP